MNENGKPSNLKKIARTTGLWYLAMAISGILGFLVFHPQVFAAGDAAATLNNLVEAESTAIIRILLEFAIVISQALTAVWFYKLFRNFDQGKALSLSLWGTVNTIVILFSAIAMTSAFSLAHADTPSQQEKLLAIQILQTLSSKSWSVGGLFFGLWLLPMGQLVILSKAMPLWLGRVILIGGAGYILSAFIRYSGFYHPMVDLLTIPATIGEFWIIGYMLIYGIRPKD